MKKLPAFIFNNYSRANCCPICREERHQYLFVVRGLPIARCSGCDLLSIFPFPNLDSYIGFDTDGQDPALLWTDSETEDEAASAYTNLLKEFGLSTLARLLLIAPPGHSFALIAAQQNFTISQHVTIRQLEEGVILSSEYDAAVVLFQLEKTAEPMDYLSAIRNALKPDGLLFLVAPSLDSFSARLFGRQWIEWRPENRYYFNEKTIQLLLWRAGFRHLEIKGDSRRYTLDHIHDRARSFPKTIITRFINVGYRFLPRLFHDTRLRLPTSAMIVTAKKKQINDLPVCSIILPVFNEANTFSILIDSLLDKKLEGIKKEVVIVESNSTDGTREQVLKYKDHPDVKIILQNQARGKGNAVREGFAHASGDIILIQDADLEYDLNDYETLLKPVVNFQTPFVLGSRHTGRWKMRKFEDQQALSAILNFGHVFFTSLINILYGQRMKDPFTMYKIFRRDCLWGLEFDSNRFDFDHELVIKLVRKGYTPLEIPVNYQSRSFKQGKKVRLIRDPFTWLWVDVKYRFVPILKKNIRSINK
jgi:hypothetical protein